MIGIMNLELNFQHGYAAHLYYYPPIVDGTKDFWIRVADAAKIDYGCCRGAARSISIKFVSSIASTRRIGAASIHFASCHTSARGLSLLLL